MRIDAISQYSDEFIANFVIKKVPDVEPFYPLAFAVLNPKEIIKRSSYIDWLRDNNFRHVMVGAVIGMASMEEALQFKLTCNFAE
jgi:uncharacterized membrane protein